MTSSGWHIATVTAGVVALIIVTGTILGLSLAPISYRETQWPLTRKIALATLPVIAGIWFLLCAYGASHMFDPIPGYHRSTTVTVEAPK